MEFLQNFSLQELTGISSDLLVLILIAVVIVLIIVTIRNGTKQVKLKRSYDAFMMGKNARSLEGNIITRLNQIDKILEDDQEAKKSLKILLNHLDYTYQKMGLVKYDAFDQLGGKLSFSLCLLNRKNDGFIINAMHSREGCYTYMKEIIDGNAVLMLSEEEKEALDIALSTTEKE